MDSGLVAGVFGLIGAAIGSASSIAAMIIQARMKDKRDRSKQLTDMSLAEFKMHLDLATSGGGPSAILPPSAFLYHNDLLLKAIETGTYTPEKAREISALNDQMFDVVRDIDKQRKKGSGM
jgi:hypothetical protein